MELTNSEIRDVSNGFTQISTLRITDETVNWKIARVNRILKPEMEAINNVLAEASFKYFELDEKGFVKVGDKGSTYRTPQARLEHIAFANKFLDEKVILDSLPEFSEQDFIGAEITPSMRTLILPIIKK